MRLRIAGGVAVCAALVLAAGAAARPLDGGQGNGHPGGGPGQGHGAWFNRVCDAASTGDASCSSFVVTDANGTPLASSSPPPGAYGPAQFTSAYSLPSATAGSGQTIAIVDAYDDPNAESDLAVFSSQYGLPPCTTSNGCFRKVNQSGGTRYPRANSGWALEISLDVQTAHGICPNCKILLVEASSATMANLGTAVNRAVSLGATVVSNSYGGNEYSSETSDESAYFNHPGVAITVSSGDSGYGVQFPAASRYVTAVGGTTLNLNADGSWKSETAWSGSGSGCSAYVTKPTWQTDTGCGRRTVADVSADADPNTGAAVYDSVSYQGQKGWFQVGGTSLAAPLIAGVYALAGNVVSYGSDPYGHTSSLHDVTSGSNGSCGGSYLCTAGTGYDGPTGLGSPKGTGGF
jgi:subtilase family serine protease